MNNIEISLYELLVCLSNAEDLVSPTLANHHQQVAYLSLRLAEQCNYSILEKRRVFLAALLHDIGALSTVERLELIENEPITVNNHGFQGAKLLKHFKPLKEIVNIIKFHHLPWNNGEGRYFNNEKVPLGSHIIHLADRTCTLIKTKDNVLGEIPNILLILNKKANKIFEPSLLEALQALSNKEYIWLDIASSSPLDKIPDLGILNAKINDIDDIVDIALLFSQIIDFRSRFTSHHSAGVAKTAAYLARLCGFSEYECKMMLVAGYLHDIGKLAIDNSILEKPAKLTDEEFTKIRSHTYYTYQLLDSIKQFDKIKEWAAYHHEKINGEGYPFHIKGDDLSLGSRIMAVADIFTGITEDRPYRKGMTNCQAVKVLTQMVENEAIDANVVNILIQNYDELNTLREQSQLEALERYNNFLIED